MSDAGDKSARRHVVETVLLLLPALAVGAEATAPLGRLFSLTALEACVFYMAVIAVTLHTRLSRRCPE